LTPTAFYCVSDERFFLGAVGLINSLRLHGHREPIYLLDAGLTDAQRELLAPQATIVPAPTQTPPYLLKTVAPLAHPAEVMVLIDVDMIVTRPLGELIERARRGGVVAFRDGLDRFVPEWGELLDLGPARPGPYVCVGLVIAGGSPGKSLLAELERGQGAVEFERTFYGSNDPDYPFRYPEQDVLNAVLRSELEPADLLALDERLALTPPFEGAEVVDANRLHCAFADGSEPYVLHHHGPKPWLEALHQGAYSRLLQRALTGPDLAIRVASARLPLRLREGPLASLARALVDLRWRWRWHVRREPVTAPLGSGA
jgi:hypothetical protein